MMTKRERLGRDQIVKKMSEQGYPTYASILELFDLHLTKDPGVVGYMVPDEGEITVNEYLDIDQVSVVVRHEILHEFLEHKKRSQAANIPMDQLSNIAADYEISNLGYTDKDKVAVRSLKLGDKIVKGLVTDHDHPDLVDKTYEEIYKALKAENKQDPGNGFPQMGDRGSSDIQDAENAQRIAEAIKEKASQAEQQANQDLNNSGDPTDGSGNSSNSADGSDDTQKDSSQSSGASGGSDSDDTKKGKSRNKYDDDAYKNMSPEEKKKERARRRKEAAKKLKEEADKVIDDIKKVLDDANDDSSSDGGPGKDSNQVFDSPEEKKERSERIAKIKEVLKDLNKMAEAKLESSSAILKEKQDKAARDTEKYRQNALTRFTESLNKFIKDAIARQRSQSWAHINKKYVYSGLLKPGYTSSGKGAVPLINVYFDRSGSWDASKTEKGSQCISTLNKYVIRGEIALKLYYFNTRIMDQDPGGHGGTDGQPILDHIHQTNPNNVIVLTDGDISDCKEHVEVPGAVWLLFYGERSQNLIDSLSGKRLTKIFDVD